MQKLYALLEHINRIRFFGAYQKKWRLIKYTLITLFTTSILGLMFLGWLHRNYIQDMITQQFTLQKVFVQGRTFTPITALLSIPQLKRYTPIFDISPQDITNQIKQIGWIKDVTVTRIFPNMVFIHLYEKNPAAIIQKPDKTFYLTTIDGETIATYDNMSNIPKNFTDLPFIISDSTTNNLTDFWDVYQHLPPSLSSHLKYTVIIQNYRMNLVMDTGVTLYLPHQVPSIVLQNILKKITPTRVLDGQWQIIDLRIPQQWLFIPLTKKLTHK